MSRYGEICECSIYGCDYVYLYGELYGIDYGDGESRVDDLGYIECDGRRQCADLIDKWKHDGFGEFMEQ